MSGLSVAVTRYTFGVSYALEASRYVMASSFFVIAALTLGGIALQDLSAGLPRRVKLYSTVLSAFGILLFVGVFCRYEQSKIDDSFMENSRYSELRGAVAADSAELLELPAFHDIYPHPGFADFETNVRFLNAEGWLRPPLWDERFLHRLRGLNPTPPCGALDTASRTTNAIRLQGWAYLPLSSQRAHAILIVGFQGNNAPKLLGVAFTSTERPDVAAALHSPQALPTGWTIDLPLAALDGHSYTVQSFAYNAETGRVCETPGGRSLP